MCKMCNSAIYTVNQTSIPLETGAQIPIGTTNRRFGRNISQTGDGIVICGHGYYTINAAFTLTAAAAGAVTVTTLIDGVPLQGASASATAGAVGDIVTLPISAMTRVTDCNSGHTITFQLTGVGATLTNAGVVVEKI